jgi:carbon monoxide dehydrogenase subunit G
MVSWPERSGGQRSFANQYDHSAPSGVNQHNHGSSTVLLEDKLNIKAPRSEVWAFLIDPERFASCIPGMDEVKQIDDRTFDGTVGAAVGPITGKFAFRASIIDSEPPSDLSALITGTDSVTRSTVTTESKVHLVELGPAETQVAYRSELKIGGRMAILGDMVMRATATLMVEEFMKRVRDQLESGHQPTSA